MSDANVAATSKVCSHYAYITDESDGVDWIKLAWENLMLRTCEHDGKHFGS